jgi:hypothetical protein
MECEARLRGLWRIISSKTVIAVNVPTRGGSGGREVFVHHPRWLPRSEGGTPSWGGRGHDALAPMMVAALHAGATPAPPGSGGMRCVRARRLRTQGCRAVLLRARRLRPQAVEGCAACGRDARAPRQWRDALHADATPTLPGEQLVRRGRSAACGRDARAPRGAGMRYTQSSACIA